MKKTNHFSQTLMLLGGMLVSVAVSSDAQTAVLSLKNYTSLDLVQVGGIVGGVAMPNAYIGIYTFGVSGVSDIPGGLPSTIQSVCLSPLGDLFAGDVATYNYQTFAAANPGVNPMAWAQGSGATAGQLWGIQNANYLWLEYSATVENKNDATGAAALALAMYDALYNSSGYGTIGTKSSPYFVPSFASSAEQTDFNTDIASLNAGSVEANLSDGYVLDPIDQNSNGPSGQEFIILAPGETNNIITPVPETTTIVAASLLLLPFGASTMRGFRKKRSQQ